MSTKAVAKVSLVVGLFVLAAVASESRLRGQGQTAAPQVPLHEFDWRSNFPRWALPGGQQALAALDGNRLKVYVNEFCAIPIKYRDAGHPQFWGRIAGSEADAWNAEWVMAKLKAAGAQNVHAVPMDLTEPQWFGESWEVTASGAQTLKLTSAQAYTGAKPTPPGGIEADAVWLGLGSPADFQGRDVRGKAAVIFTYMSGFTSNANFYGGVNRAAENGAAAILVINNVPGNLKIQAMLGGPGSTGATKITMPIFNVGKEDGEELRKIIEAGPTKVRVSLNAKTMTGLKSSNVWGTLPGQSKEELVILAHRDGFFEGAGDNASGMAVMIGLAEFLGKLPMSQRPKTIKFLATTGHHHPGLSGPRLVANEKDKYLSNAVFLVNLEHVAWTNTVPHSMGSPKPVQRFTTGVDARRWFVYGSDKLATLFLTTFRDFGIGTWDAQDRANPGEGSPFSTVLPNVGFISSPVQMHSDGDVPDMVPATGLEQIARATAKILIEVGKMSKADLAPRPVSSTSAQR